VRDRWKVIIIGGGFGGLAAARALKSADVDVTLIDERNFHLFQPLLYQVATGSLSPGEVAAPLRSVLSRQKNACVLLGRVVDIDPVAKFVQLADGARLEYDSLIVAAGAQSSYYGHDEWREWAPSLKSVEEATSIRNKILCAFEVAERITDPALRHAWLTFVIVGGGATGVELAGAIAEIARQTLKDDFRSIDPKEAQIILVDGGPRLLSAFPPDLALKAQRSLEKLGVHVRTGIVVKEIDKEGLTYQSKDCSHRMSARTVLWAGGVTASPLGRTLADRTSAETDRGGKIKVTPQLTLAGYRDIYVVGDLALSMGSDGKPLPGVAPVAMQQGAYAAKAILKNIRGDAKPAAFHYIDRGSLAVIGRWAAVADIFSLHLSGLIAWLVWACVHLMNLVQFQSRILVFIHWAFQDLTFSRGARLITQSAVSEVHFEEEVASSEKVGAETEARTVTNR
jgi:NADH dehydrogenase